MDITALPFSRLIGLEHAEPESGHLLSLPDNVRYSNHIGSVHAGALLALAESSCGEFLLRWFGDHSENVAVVRRVQAKFKKPAFGRVSGRVLPAEAELARLAESIESRGSGTVNLTTQIVDDHGQIIMYATIDWFVARPGHASEPEMSTQS